MLNSQTARDVQVTAEMLALNDAFGCGCVIAYLCSGGKHPFQNPQSMLGRRQRLADNIRNGRRSVRFVAVRQLVTARTMKPRFLSSWRN